MATAATLARPAQALRNRRDAPRPPLSKRSATNMDGPAEAPSKKRKLNEPYARDADFILRKHKGKQPSLILHLYPGYFKFDGQDGSFAYDSPMRFILEHVKTQTVPHKMMDELLQSNVTFYDGCLIVEVHNHRYAGKDKARHDSGGEGDSVKFSMHNYNPHVTPSPFVPYPSKAKEAHIPIKAGGSVGGMAAPERPKEKEKEKNGPKITTVVLHPTELTRHEELKILANTPASDVRSKKRGSDGGTPSESVPPTPIGQAPRPAGSASQKMCLEEADFYTFQADMLMATTEPLYLNPCDTPQQSDAIIDMLQHPNHQDQPPSPKIRKRTTAEVAADDAQAAEIERRMLIMDERIKATGTGSTAGEAQGAANAMPFQRFKTLDMVRQKHEEAERTKKDEEARKAAEKKEAEEQHAQQQKMMMAQRQREMMMAGQGNQQQQQQLLIQQRRAQQAQAQAQQAQAQQQALMNAQNHAHPQQNAMMPNQQQSFPQANQGSMTQSSPVVRQHTPMMNSSPMMPQGGFPMAQTSSQGPGSPQRPTSAMQHPMARQMSQQHRGSQGGNTPQLAQGTPSMAQAMPNRQVSQTPRMASGSPAGPMQQGTPVSAPMYTPGAQNQLTPHQMQMLEHSQMNRNMMPDQIQNISNMQRQQSMQQHMQRNAMMQAAQGNPQQMAAMQQRQRQLMAAQQQQQQQQQRSQMLAAQQQQQQQMQHAGSPGGMGGPMQTPQVGHAHPQQQQAQQGMPDGQQLQQQQQQRAQQMAARQRIQHLAQQYGGYHQIPPQLVQTLPQQMQAMIRQMAVQTQQARQQQMRQQAQARGQLGPNQSGGEQVPGGPGDPQYMAALRQQQQMLGQLQQQQGGQQGGMNGMTGMGFPMGGNPGQGQGAQNFGGQGGQQGPGLAREFEAMQAALNRGQ